MTMIERVAKAACEAGYHQWPLTDGYNDRAEKRAWLKIARAAIEAMREPTESMRAARFRVRCRGGQAEWEAMIDQALKDEA